MEIPEAFTAMVKKLASKLTDEEMRELRDLLDGDAYDDLLGALDSYLD